jgi:hypothetical protein
MELAAEPSDVIWQNCGIWALTRYLKKLIAFLITLGLIGLNFLVIYFIEKKRLDFLQVVEVAHLDNKTSVFSKA